MERKEFVKRFAIGGSILMTAPVLFSGCSEDDDPIIDNGPGGGGQDLTIDLSSPAFAALGTVGGYAYSGNIIIIRLSESQYVALSKLCTHQNCEVAYSKAEGRIVCPYHGSKFETSGAVHTGPASIALKSYTVTVSGNSLKIS